MQEFGVRGKGVKGRLWWRDVLC